MKKKCDNKSIAEMIQERYPQPGRNGKPSSEEDPGVTEPPPPVETFTAADLMRMRLPEPRWAVEGILPEGLCLLAGKPKLGKSWLALGIALAVATGGSALGKIAVEEGDVLYLALEDTKRRLQGRLDKLLEKQNAEAPARLTLAVDCPRQDKGGLAWMTEWLAAHKKARLVIIDTWAKFKPRQLVRTNEYEADYAHGAELKAAADKEGLAILALHHCCKMGAADPLEEVSGSVGLTGVADAVLVLRRERGQHDAALHVTGRDVEERELALNWHPECAQWSIIGEAEEFRMSKERAGVVALLRKAGRPMKPSEAAPLLEKSVGAVKKLFWSMAEAGQLQAIGGGFYAVTSNRGNRGKEGIDGNRSNRCGEETVTGDDQGGNRFGNPDDEPHYRFPN